jgi:hypothetical protein
MLANPRACSGRPIPVFLGSSILVCDSMAGMRVSKIAVQAGAWVSAVLAVWAVLAVLNTLILVPANPDLTDLQNLGWKLGTAGICAAVSYLFFRLSRLAFRTAKSMG